MVKVGIAKTSQKSVNISKGLLYVFFSIYLVILGIILTGFIETLRIQNPGLLPAFVPYIPFVCYIAALFLGIMFIFFVRSTTIQKSRESKSRKSQTGSLYRRALFLIIFIFAFIPLFSPVIDNGTNDQYFSIYNSGWNGGSYFKADIENAGYDVMSVQSSLSAINRIEDKSVLLVLFGTNQFYDPIFEIPFFVDFFGNTTHKNSILICHDHGSTYELLWQIFIANLANIAQNPDIFPMTIMADGILRDNESCLQNAFGQGDSSFPIIRNFAAHETTVGINEVILSEASAAAGGQLLIENLFHWDVIGQSSLDNSFVDKNNNGKYDYNTTTKDYTDSIDLSLFTNFLISLGPPFDALENHSEFSHLPLGSSVFAPVVFLAKEFANHRVFVSSDASLFSNDLINRYDNKQFGLNIIKWLTYNGIDNPNDWVVVFDEAHIRPEYSRDLTSAGIFGFIMQYIIHLSTNPITAWIYPLWAFYSLRKYLPKKDKDSEKKKIEQEEEKEEKEKFRTSSFFVQKINWYKDKNRYEKALILLFRRIERKLHAQLGGVKITTKKVIDFVVAKESGGKISRQKIKRLTKLMDRMLVIKEGKSKVRSPQEFENLFLEMSWAMKNI